MHNCQHSSQHQLQQLVLTPEMRQSLRILQMPLVELEAYLSAQVMENCALEISSPNAQQEYLIDELSAYGDAVPGPADRTGHQESPVEPGRIISGSYDYLGEELPSLYDHLYLQLQMAKLSDEQIRIGEFLIMNIDANGYLRCSVAEAVGVLMAQPEEIAELIRAIQSFEPPGVCCRDLTECLSLQWQINRHELEMTLGLELYQITARIINQHLDEIAAGNLNRIAARLKQPLSVIRQAADQIKKLDPKPGRNYGPLPGAPTLMPDVSIIKYGSSYQILIESSPGVCLVINPFYRRLINNPEVDPATILYIQEKVQAAVCLLKGLEQRNNTLRKIVAAIVERQHDFLEKGPGWLTPLTLQETAAELSMHESTVSRAIQGKYISTPHGVYLLKFFFQSRLNTTAGGSIAAETVKKIIKDLIHAENKQNPYSDQQITVLLQKKDIVISRRTIAKYREELTIPPAAQRKILE